MEVNGSLITHFNGNEINLGNWTKLSMREAIIKFWPKVAGHTPRIEDFDNGQTLISLLKETLASANPKWNAGTADSSLTYSDSAVERNNWETTCRGLLSRLDAGEAAGAIIANVFELLSEPYLIQPTIIYDFPLAVSPLSKIKPSDPDWVERFEFYIGGFEVGNAFSELNDPVDQHNRFAQQLEQKERGDEEAMSAIDEDYVRALGYGLPPTAGEGIGIDRLTMLLTNSSSIRDVILFPLMRPRQKTAEQVAQKEDQPHGESAE
jgi:lysyl-tRNA synthetase class 2